MASAATLTLMISETQFSGQAEWHRNVMTPGISQGVVTPAGR
jgi:hypothetical protein